jgi:arabinofuranan 3-O-arabinosyltransferase
VASADRSTRVTKKNVNVARRAVSPSHVAALALWPIALGSFAYRCLVLPAFRPASDWDAVWRAAVVFTQHQNPYTMLFNVNGGFSVAFPYPPSALLLFVPFTLVPYSAAKVGFLIINAAAVVVGAALSMTLVRLDWRSFAGAIVLFGLSLARPVTDTLEAGNVNGLLLCVEAAMLLAAARGRWGLAGLLMGIGLAIKPVLLPLLLLFVVTRQWRTLAIGMVVPIVLSIPFLINGRSAITYLTHTTPLLLTAQANYFTDPNVALTALSGRLHTPVILVGSLRLIVVGVAVWLLRVRWRTDRDETLRLVECTGIILVATFLSSSFSWSYYAIYLLPLLLSVVHGQSVIRNAVSWGGIYLLFTDNIWASKHQGHLEALFSLQVTAGYLLLLVGMALGLRHWFLLSRRFVDAVSYVTGGAGGVRRSATDLISDLVGRRG